MEKTCSYGETLEELLNRPKDLLVLNGADGEENESEMDEDDAEDEGENDDQSDESGDGEEEDAEDGKSKEDPRIQRLKEENIAQRTKYKNARAKVQSLEAEIAQLKKDGTTDEATKKHYSDVEKANEQLASVNKDLALKVAFLSDNTHSWVDPKAALRLAELDDVEIDDKGNVDGLASALEKLAEESPWLLKAADKQEKPRTKKTDIAPKSGDQPKGAPGSEASQKAQAAKLRSKYPGLRR